MSNIITIPYEELEISKQAASEVATIINGKKKTYYIETYGCQMNVHDSEKLAGALTVCGFTEASVKQEADIIIFNTCCIREHAEKRLMGNVGALKKLKDERPELVIAICGCMVQQKDEADKLYNRFPFVDLIFGTNELHKFPVLLKDVINGKRIKIVRDIDGEIAEDLPVKRNDSVSQFVTIMYGCNNYCSYCIVPYVRGRERSRKPENIVAEIKALADNGTKEITLLGQNVNSYHGEGGVDFPDLLRMVAEIDGIQRIRFMTSHPKDLSPKLIEAMSELEKVCNHIHLPVQSGSNSVLKAMNRNYTKEKYISVVENLREANPGIELTTDIIVGFPGETEEDFNETLDLINRIGYSAAYTFKYSKRTGTSAARMENQIPEEIKKERLSRLNDAVSKKLREGNAKYLGIEDYVLVEGVDNRADVMAFGKLSNFKMVYFPGDKSLIGKTVKVKITGIMANSLVGEITAENS